MLLKNKNAVIYGAGGAIGGAVARAFAREGAKLFLVGRTLAKVEAVAQEISATGGVAEAAQVEALDEQAVEKHIRDVAKRAGSIDLLFNAIGMEDIQGTPLLDMSLDDFAHPVIIATRTQFLTARAAARHMVKQGAGVILTITAVPDPAPNVGGFDVACAAIEGLWRSFAAELGPQGIRFGVLRSPGSPDTPAVQEMFRLHAKASGKSLEEYLAGSSNLPLVAEVVNVAVLMAADLASAKSATVAIVTCGSVGDKPAGAEERA
ncbi:MAG: SDR family oxidoreductase [Chloroflexi bacterium]|nr:SDR family oxidoreductase [Chloroflexota bacterium]